MFTPPHDSSRLSGAKAFCPAVAVKEYALLDVFKFVAAIGVVFIHFCVRYMDFYGEEYLPWFNKILKFAVPFFFCASGYLVGERLRASDSKQRKIKLLKSSLKAVKLTLIWTVLLSPFFVWFVIDNPPYLLRVFYGVKSLLVNGYLYDQSIITWFLAAMALWYLLMALATGRRSAMWLLLGLSVACYFVRKIALADPDSHMVFQTGLLSGGLPLMFGYLVGLYLKKVRPWHWIALMVLTVTAFVLGGRYCPLGEFGGAAMMMFCVWAYPVKIKCHLYLRRMSEWIYFIHLFFLALMCKWLAMAGMSIYEMTAVTLGAVLLVSALLARRQPRSRLLRRLV